MIKYYIPDGIPIIRHYVRYNSTIKGMEYASVEVNVNGGWYFTEDDIISKDDNWKVRIPHRADSFSVMPLNVHLVGDSE